MPPGRWIVIVALTLLAVCGQAEGEVREEVWLDKKNILHYRGQITAQKFDRLQAVYAGAKVKPALLRIESGGGKGHIGIAMGEWIQEKSLDIYVKKKCFSSCANFVFVSGRKKYLSETALLMWHGGLNQKNLKGKVAEVFKKGNEDIDHEGGVSIREVTDGNTMCPFDTGDIDSAAEQVMECLEGWAEREKSFYEKLGIDSNLPYYGQKGEYEPVYQSKEYYGFYYSLADLQKMRVEGIILKGESWRPEESKDFERAKLYQVSL